MSVLGAVTAFYMKAVMVVGKRWDRATMAETWKWIRASCEWFYRQGLTVMVEMARFIGICRSEPRWAFGWRLLRLLAVGGRLVHVGCQVGYHEWPWMLMWWCIGWWSRFEMARAGWGAGERGWKLGTNLCELGRGLGLSWGLHSPTLALTSSRSSLSFLSCLYSLSSLSSFPFLPSFTFFPSFVPFFSFLFFSFFFYFPKKTNMIPK